MKFNGVSKKENGKYAKIDGKWYTMPENVRKFVLAQGFKDGDEVNIKSEQQDNATILTYIEKVGGSSGPGPESKPAKTYGQKSPEEQDIIKKQAVMKAVCSAIGGCKDVDINTLGDLICSIYDKALAKVNE